MTFKEYFIERVYDIPEEEDKNIDKLVERYRELVFKDPTTRIKISHLTPQKYFEKDINEDGRLKIGRIKVKDLGIGKDIELNVLIDFTKGGNNMGEFYDDSNDIVLYYYALGFSVYKIKDTLTHEILHAKQHYKKMSKKYKQSTKTRKRKDGSVTFRSNRGYYLDPLELPVYTTLIIKQFYKEYKESDKLQRKQLKLFLANFIKTGARPTVDVAAPDTVVSKNDFLKFLFLNRKNKKYSKIHKNFIKKLYWVYSKLK